MSIQIVDSSVEALQSDDFWQPILTEAVLDTDRHFSETALLLPHGAKKPDCIDATLGIEKRLGPLGKTALSYDGGHFWNSFRAGSSIWFIDAYYGVIQREDEPQILLPLVSRSPHPYELNCVLAAISRIPEESVVPAYQLRPDGTSQELAFDEAVAWARSRDLLQSLGELYVAPEVVPTFIDSFLQALPSQAFKPA